MRRIWIGPRSALRLVLLFGSISAWGCAESRWPRIDPTGERIFAPAPEPVSPRYREVPAGQLPWDPVELLLTPRSSVAPVGSEVVLLAAVRGPDNYLRTNERVEWSISAGSVGQFVDLDRGTYWDLMLGDFTCPRKISSTLAVGSTSRRHLRLTRGTPDPSDDVLVARGQTWITVSSPVEGTTYVTAYARRVYGWERHKQTAAVHWVDAQWRLPAPAITAAGTRQVLTTTVSRLSDQSGCAGWRVRYTISGGPPAGFAPSGAQTVEVETDSAGQASVEILQQQPVAGTSRVDIQVIRPMPPHAGAATGLVLGTGSTLVSWSGPGMTLRKRGPLAGTPGAALTYRLEVSNPGDLPAEGVVLADQIPEGASYLTSDPPGQLTDRSVVWQLGRLAPGASRTVEISIRAERAGTLRSCAEATTADGLRARDCLSTTISPTGAAGIPPISLPTPPIGAPGVEAPPAGLEVRLVGPDQVRVGQNARFVIVLTNRGQTAASGLALYLVFDPGLVHQQAKLRNELRRLLPGVLAPGESAQVEVEFFVAKAGQLCQTVEATGSGGLRATARKCVTAVEGPAPGAAAAIPGPPTPSADRIVLKLTSDVASATVGQTVKFIIDLTNKDPKPLTNVKLGTSLDPALVPQVASKGFQKDALGLWWTLPALPPGQMHRFEIHCKCAKAALEACLRVQVSSQEGAQAQQSVCVAIREPGAGLFPPAAPSGPPPLDLTLRTYHEPVSLGRELTYLVSVANRGQTDQTQVTVTVELPPELIPVPVGTVGPAGRTIQRQLVAFEPVSRLAPGGALEYRVRAQARKPGKVRVVAAVTSQSLREPNTAELWTTINEG
ncbi:MAG: hypothetical protein ACUVUC_15540 [Thermoguttaceae bacterium]